MWYLTHLEGMTVWTVTLKVTLAPARTASMPPHWLGWEQAINYETFNFRDVKMLYTHMLESMEYMIYNKELFRVLSHLLRQMTFVYLILLPLMCQESLESRDQVSCSFLVKFTQLHHLDAITSRSRPVMLFLLGFLPSECLVQCLLRNNCWSLDWLTT